MTALPTRYEPPVRREWLDIMAPAIDLAKAIAHTDFVPKHFRGNPAAISAAILYGDEVGLGPMQSLAKINIIEGKPTLYAEAQRALILGAGHELWIEEATNTRVTIAGRRKDSDVVNTATWTMDDARRAGLAGKKAWREYPQDMLLARATARLARAVFADAIGGLAAAEEFEDVEPGAGGSSPPVSTTTRKRRQTTPLAAVTAAAEPEPAAAPPLPGEQESAAGSLDDDTEEPPPAAEFITDQQRKKLHAAFRDAGFNNRESRLAFTTFHTRRPVESSSELTVDEASRLIDLLESGPYGAREPPSEDEIEQQLKQTLDAMEKTDDET
jgi:hypothetical protein